MRTDEEKEVMYSLSKILLRGLLEQGLIDKELYYKADRLNALSFK